MKNKHVFAPKFEPLLPNAQVNHASAANSSILRIVVVRTNFGANCSCPETPALSTCPTLIQREKNNERNERAGDQNGMCQGVL